MPSVANLYDSGPISPIVKIKENLAVWSAGQWAHFNVDFIEPLPRSDTMVAEMVSISGAAALAANGIIQKQLMQIFRLRENELLHLRFEPLDDVVGLLWEQSSQGRFATGYVQAHVTKFTVDRDPFLSTTTFFVLGVDKDANLEVRNPNAVVVPQARFVFWGFRYLLTALKQAPAITTYIPAEGRQ